MFGRNVDLKSQQGTQIEIVGKLFKVWDSTLETTG